MQWKCSFLTPEDEEADQMGDEPMDTAAGGRGDEMCQMSSSLEDEHVALSTSISQLLELPPHGEDAAVVVPPDPPDLSPGITHKVLWAHTCIRFLSR